MTLTNKGKETVLAIPDMHTPFEHPDTIPFLKWLREKYRPTKVVCLGDEIDMHAVSDHDKDPDGFSAGHELERAIEHLQPVYRLFPDVLVCTSNHTARPYRQAFKFGLPKAFLKSYHEFLGAPRGWVWADSHEVDGVIYEHGEGFSGQQAAINAAKANAQSTVIGHVHSFAGIQFSANPKQLIFGFNVGCLIDKTKYAFAYGNKFKNKPIIGAGIIRRGIPVYIPMIMDSSGRWVKR